MGCVDVEAARFRAERELADAAVRSDDGRPRRGRSDGAGGRTIGTTTGRGDHENDFTPIESIGGSLTRQQRTGRSLQGTANVQLEFQHTPNDG